MFLESDLHGDVLWVWSYPAVNSDLRHVIIRKCEFQNHQDTNKTFSSVYGRFHEKWYYITAADASEAKSLSKVITMCGMMTVLKIVFYELCNET